MLIAMETYKVLQKLTQFETKTFQYIYTTHRFKCMNNLTYDVQSVEIQYLTIPKTWYFEICIELP
jgi:hypothetical protein